MDLRGAINVITGASGGIGPAIARACASRGSDLVLTGRNEDALRPLADELHAKVIVADLADAADVAHLTEALNPVDVLISNAALPGGGKVASFSVEEIDRVVDVNLRTPIVLSRRLASG